MFKFLALLIIFLLLTFPQATFAQTKVSKRVEVNLTQQRLYAYQNNTLIYNFPITK
jgi:hypothetical protein